MIDEIQMMRDTDRGWAWSRALLGEFKQIGKDTFHDGILISMQEFELRDPGLSPVKVYEFVLQQYALLSQSFSLSIWECNWVQENFTQSTNNPCCFMLVR